MGDEEYYRVLGQAVDSGKLADEIKNARDDADRKNAIRIRTGIELSDTDLADVKEAVDLLPELSRPRPGGKMRR